MSEKKEKKLNKDIQRMLGGMMTWEEERRKKAEVELWKRAGAPCLFYEALSRLTKHELDEIRKASGIPGMSALKKADLAKELSEFIPMIVRTLLYRWDEERYQVLGRVLSHGGIIPYEQMTPKEIGTLSRYGLLFHGINEGKKVLFIPEDLANSLRAIEGEELSQILKRNSDWVLLTQGLLYYIGVDEYWNVLTRISGLTGVKVDPMDYSAVIGEAAVYYGEIEKRGALVFRKDVRDLSKVMSEQNKRKDMPPYPLTMAKLRKAGKPGYIEQTPEMRIFLETIRDAYGLTSSQAEVIGREMIRIINQTGDPMEVMKHLEMRIEIPDQKWFQMISGLVMDIYDHASQWELGGYAPVELSGKKKKETRSSFRPPFTVSAVPVMGSKVKEKNRKTGRNEPCLCGSGKKYKNCCGRKS